MTTSEIKKVIDPLYSLEGGHPRAFECLMGSMEPGAEEGRLCRYLCRSAKEIELHLASVHGFRTQVSGVGAKS